MKDFVKPYARAQTVIDRSRFRFLLHMINQFNEIVASLQAQMRLMGPEHPSVKKTIASDVAHVKQIIASHALTAEDTKQLYKALNDDNSPFDKPTRLHLGEAVAAAETAGKCSDNVTDDGDKQSLLFLYNYLTDELWAKLLDLSCSIDY